MTTRLPRHTLLLAAVFAAVLPAAARAQAAPPTQPTGGVAPAPALTPPPLPSQVVQVSDGGFTVAARASAILRRVARFRGTVAAEHAGRALAIERFDPLTQAWVTEATTTVGAGGGFLARWRANHIGPFRMRAVLRGGGEASIAAASPELAVTVYKSATATWYGPGFYGRMTACGQRMSRSLLGVAHRRVPCGAQVAIFHAGRTVIVPVVDRGPFRHGVTWDLTKATADALGFTVTGRIGAVRLREPAAAPGA